MRKLIRLHITALLMLTMILAVTANANADAVSYQIGDTDKDGDVNIADSIWRRVCSPVWFLRQRR